VVALDIKGLDKFYSPECVTAIQMHRTVWRTDEPQGRSRYKINVDATIWLIITFQFSVTLFTIEHQN